jgi:hypothetical protein
MKPAGQRGRAVKWGWLALAGALVWPALWPVVRPEGFGAFWALGLTLLLAPLLLVPLAAELTARPDREGRHVWPWRLAAWLQVPATAGAIAAVVAPAGSPVAVAGAALWLAQTGLLAGFGLARLGWHGLLCVEEFAVTAGWLQLPVGGFWLLAHAAGWSLGFDALIVLLTAIHFHYAGFAAPVVAGLVGRLVPWDSGWARKLYCAGALTIAAAPPAIGIGIAASPLLEVTAALLLAAGFGLFAVVVLAHVVPRVVGLLPRLGLGVAGTALFATMALAAWYALGEIGAVPPAPLAMMARTHGWLNAYGFATLGLATLAWLRPTSRLAPPWPPFSRLQSGGRVGADFFERTGLACRREPPARGLVDTLEAHRRPGFDPDAVHPAIRDFYEDTAAWRLQVEADWRPGWRWAGNAFRVLAGRIGQLNLPRAVATERELRGRLLDLRDDADGRRRVRGWVREFRATGEPVYVAAYSEHYEAGAACMNIAFPLPGMNLTSILRFEPLPGGAAQLSSRPRAAVAGGEGVYLVGNCWRIRLPLQETIAVTPGQPAGGTGHDVGPAGMECHARHDMWFLGLPYLTLIYRMIRDAPGSCQAAPPRQ